MASLHKFSFFFFLTWFWWKKNVVLYSSNHLFATWWKPKSIYLLFIAFIYRKITLKGKRKQKFFEGKQRKEITIVVPVNDWVIYIKDKLLLAFLRCLRRWNAQYISKFNVRHSNLWNKEYIKSFYDCWFRISHVIAFEL